jgi:NAD-dependent deacetylase
VTTGTDTEALQRLADLIRNSSCTVALTGAGISVPSGIPDFRSPGTGLWEKVDPMEVAHIEVFLRDPKRFWSYYRPRFGMLEDKQPNRAHEVLAELEAREMLDAVITQNIDRLHRDASSRFTARSRRAPAFSAPPLFHSRRWRTCSTSKAWRAARIAPDR